MKKMFFKLLGLSCLLGVILKVIDTANVLASSKIATLQMQNSDMAYSVYNITNGLSTYVVMVYIVLILAIVGFQFKKKKNKGEELKDD